MSLLRLLGHSRTEVPPPIPNMYNLRLNLGVMEDGVQGVRNVF